MHRSILFLLLATLPLFGAGCISKNSGTETTGPAGVFSSIDKGDTWKQTSAYPSLKGVVQLEGVSVYRMFEDPSDAKALYWATRGEGFFYSYDNGASWQHAKAPLDTGVVYSISVDPTDTCTLFVSNGSKLYKSTDCSRNWGEVYREDRTTASIATVYVDRIDSKRVYMGKANGELLVSVDGGESWALAREFGKKARITQIVADAVDARVLYMSTLGDGLYRSVDNGVSWQRLYEPLKEFPKATSFRRLVVHPKKASTLFWISEYGILKTTNGGDSWEPLSLVTPPGSVPIYAFGISAQNEKEMYYTTFQNGRTTFYKTEDGGVSWSTKKLPSGQIPTFLRVHPEDDSIVTVGFSIPPKK
jgi:photosystem II stability/assembly factor-like uncharacterized protein